MGFPGGSAVKKKKNAYSARDLGLIPGSGRLPWRRKWQPTPVFLPGVSYGHSTVVHACSVESDSLQPLGQ